MSELKTSAEAVLYAAAVELLHARSTADVLAIAVRRTRELLGTDIAFVMLLDDSRSAVKLEASVGHRTPTFVTIVRPVSALTVIGTGEPVYSGDFLNDSHLDHDPATDDIVRKEGMRAVLAVPLVTEDRTLGALYVGHRRARQFTSAEVYEFKRLADHAAAAILRAQIDRELRAQLEDTSNAARAAEAERAALARAEDVRRALTTRMQEREGIPAFALALSQEFQRPVLITDWKLTLLAQASPGPIPDGRMWTAFLDRRDAREAVTASTQSHRPASAGPDWSVAPIEAGRSLLGYLWMGTSKEPHSASLDDLVLDRTVPIAAVEFLSAGDAQRRLHGDFIYELLSERPPDFSVLEAQAPQIWVRHGEQHRPVIANIVAGRDNRPGSLEVARRLVSAARPHDFVAVYGRHLVLLTAPADRIHTEAVIVELRRALDRNRVKAEIAVGAPCRDLSESRESILAALRLQDLIGGKDMLWTEGLEALSHLFDVAQRERLVAMRRSALAPLQGRPRLMDALQAYYQAGGNRALAARRLKVHVNTLRQRLERAEELLGGSIDDSIRAVPLRLALLVREVTQS